MEFNSPEGLASVYGDWNPTTYFLGNQSVDEAMSRDRQATQQSIQKTAQDTLKTQFETANMPQRLENQRLQNEGLGYDNVDKGVKSRINAATESAQLSNAQMKQALEADEGQIQKMQKQAQQWAYSDDPALQAKGSRLMQMSAAAVEARQKHKDEMEKQDLIRKSAERVGAGNNAATIQAAQINAASRGQGKQVDPNVVAAKLGYEKGAAYYMIQAEQASSPEERAQLLAMAQRFEQANLNQKNASAGTKPDLNKLGVPTNVVPSALGTPAQPAPPPAQTGRIRVVSSDGKVGSIPASQLQDALKAGYKEAK